MKTCTTCLETKRAGEFYRRTKSLDGLALICKACSSRKARFYYERDKESVKARASKWAAENRERRREIASQSAEKHREKKRASSRAYNKRRRAENPDAARQAGRRHAAIRRDRELSAGGVISAAMWNAIFAVFETNVCIYCGCTDRPLTMDHWVPVSRGGRTEAGNLIPCCKPCNSRKGNKMPDEWLAAMPTNAGGVSIEQFLAITAETAKLFHALYGREVQIV